MIWPDFAMRRFRGGSYIYCLLNVSIVTERCVKLCGCEMIAKVTIVVEVINIWRWLKYNGSEKKSYELKPACNYEVMNFSLSSLPPYRLLRL